MYVCLLGVFNANLVLLHFACNQALSNNILKWKALAYEFIFTLEITSVKDRFWKACIGYLTSPQKMYPRNCLLHL